MNLVILGLIFDIIGVFILVVGSIWNPWHQRREDLKWWEKRYFWSGWRPIWRNTKTLNLEIKLNNFSSRHGFIPPKYKLDIIGFLFILAGFGLQLKFYF